ncbi:MAG TPA: type 4a pilus biogenesis protein PilO [Phycisphaerae bacterium]|nr:type 4a pilus biogenesis protein PilO [Phycisphaerae bacterium]
MSRLKLNALVFGIVVILTAGFAFGFAVPGAKKLRQQRDQIASETAQVKAEQERLGNIGELYASIVALDAAMSEFNERLPQHQNFGEFLNSVSENLKASGVEDFAVQPKPPVALDAARLPSSLAVAAGTMILPVRITFDGTLAQLVDFQGRMEALPRLSQVETLKLDNDEAHPGHVRVEMVLLTFCHPQ